MAPLTFAGVLLGRSLVLLRLGAVVAPRLIVTYAPSIERRQGGERECADDNSAAWTGGRRASPSISPRRRIP
jgi:hypothetical protein